MASNRHRADRLRCETNVILEEVSFLLSLPIPSPFLGASSPLSTRRLPALSSLPASFLVADRHDNRLDSLPL
jgi:hypothetical protein